MYAFNFLNSPPLLRSAYLGFCLFVALGFLLLLYLVLLVLYNLSPFHPLHKFPGPVLYRSLRLTSAIIALSGKLPFKVLALHNYYKSPVIRIAPDELVFLSPAAWRDIYTGQPQLPKDIFTYPAPPDPPKGSPPVERPILLANDEDHARYRRVLGRAFSPKALEEVSPLVVSHVDMLIAKLRERCGDGTTENLAAWYNWTTFDIVGDLAFGESFHCLETADWHPWVKILTSAVVVSLWLSVFRRYGLMRWLNLLMPKSMKEKREGFFRFPRERVEKRLAMNEEEQDEKKERKDFISFMQRADKSGETMTMRELCGNSNILVAAGSETTATLLSGVTWFLVKNKEKLKRLVEEVRGTFEKEKHIDTKSVNDLRYMIACLSEALRMYPPVPSGLVRQVVDEKGAIIAGVWVPPKWAASHSAENWAQPDEFIPERWLPENAEKFAYDKKEATQPFSMGPRNCLGKSLAYTEMRLILARMIWNFDLQLADENLNWMDQKAFQLWEKTPLNIKLTKVPR